MTVVHRLSGWKLLTWLAASGPAALELADLPSTSDVHTNIVAGYISEDGRTVVARLPQAEAEIETFEFTPPPGAFASAAGTQEGVREYTLFTNDGRHVEAKFVGLDASTGLSLLEASEQLLPAGSPIGEQGDTNDPTVGEHIRLFAPTPASKVAAAAASPAPQAEGGFIYLSIEQREGLLTEVKRAPSGRLFRVVAKAPDISPEWTGAVAANEFGDVVGIVSQSLSGATQIVPVETMRMARERVLKFRGNAPQPWLGIRGDAVAQAPLDTWVNLGWKPELARPRIEEKQGVFLTSVAPGTPAALAGFLPGDVITSVGPRELRSVEDLSSTLKEAGVGSTVDFTVWRAFEPAPVKLSVQLQGAQNPALATAEAEVRAVRESLFTLRSEVQTDEQLLKGGTPPDADAARLSARLSAAQGQIKKLQEQMEEAEARIESARASTLDAPEMPLARARGFASTASLQSFGLNAVGLTARIAARLGAAGGGLLVVAVRPDTPCAASGLRAGDVIEKVNGLPVTLVSLQRLVSGYESTTPVALGVVREGRRLTVNLSLTSEDGRQWK